VVGDACPICGVGTLQGRQTTCSAACRRERGRIREVMRLQDQLLVLRALVDALLATVNRPVARRQRR
jgi:predicted nucleic acid-binding Zn ribbon protein